MIIKAFCATNAKNSGTPGTQVRNIRLVCLAGAPNDTPPNQGVFTANQAIPFDLPNVTAGAASEFDAGDLVEITITKVTPPAS